MKSVIITGANGFVGYWLVKALSLEGYKVYAVVRNNKATIVFPENVHTVVCDMKNISNLETLIKDRNIESFFHLAWEGSGGEKRADYTTQLCNVQYSCDAVMVAARMGIKNFLAAGTITERIVEGIVDQNSISPNMIYAIMKKTTKSVLSVLCKKMELEFTWLQFSNVYGPFNTTGNLISYAMESVIKGQKAKFSSGKQPYDFIYVEDLVCAIKAIMECNHRRNEYFIGSGSNRRLKDFLMDLKEVLGEDKIEIGVREDDGVIYESQWFDISELQQDTQFQAKVEFKTGLKRTMEWIKSERKEVKK